MISEKATSLLTCRMSASRSQSPISSAGYSTPFVSIFQAVARVSAVTPVIIRIVSLDGSRFVAGQVTAVRTASTVAGSPPNPKPIVNA